MTHERPGPNAAVREELIEAITAFLSNQPKLPVEQLRAFLRRELDLVGPSTLSGLRKRLVALGSDWGYYSADPLARHLHHVLAERLLDKGSSLAGGQHVAAVAGTPVVIISNHLSYADANLLEILLHRGGWDELADRLTTIAGPKVYSTRERRFSALCFGTVKTPQSAGVSSGEAVMTARQVAAAARRSLDAALERLRLGDGLIVFGEGTRSRNGEMQPMLAGVARYFEGPATHVLPVGITGTETLFPIGEEELRPVRILANVGAPIPTAALVSSAGGDRRLQMGAVGLAIAQLLPAAYRGVYGRDDDPGLAEARRVLDAARPAA